MKTKITRFYYENEPDVIHIEGNALNTFETLCGNVDTHEDNGVKVDVETRPNCDCCLNEWYRLRDSKL